MANKIMKTLTLGGNTYEIYDETARNNIASVENRMDELEEKSASGILVDTELSETSTNPVQNAVVTAKFSQLSDTVNDHKGNANIHVTNEEKQTWNNKSNFSGSYNDLTDKPKIPEGSDLTGYATENFVKEYSQPKGEYLTPSNLSDAVNTALAQAKESGEFDGENGHDGQDGSDGITPHIGNNGNWYLGETDTGVKAQGSDGQDGEDGYTPIKGIDYFTETDKNELVTDVLEALPTWTGGSY